MVFNFWLSHACTHMCVPEHIYSNKTMNIYPHIDMQIKSFRLYLKPPFHFKVLVPSVLNFLLFSHHYMVSLSLPIVLKIDPAFIVKEALSMPSLR